MLQIVSPRMMYVLLYCMPSALLLTFAVRQSTLQCAHPCVELPRYLLEYCKSKGDSAYLVKNIP